MNLLSKQAIQKSILFALLLLLSSCKAGLFVTKASGTISLSNTELGKENNALVLVFAYQHTGLKLNSDEYLFQKNAFLVYPDEQGKYSFSPAKKGEKFEVYFFAPHFKTQSTSFLQTIGVREVIYDVKFQKNSQWRKSYFFSIRPLLSEILEEEKYQLPARDILFLDRWLEMVEKELK